LARRKKTASGLYIDIKPEIIEFQQVLNQLQIDKDQLICLAILVGTDYNPGGVKGLGQKRALEIVQKFKYPVQIFEHLKKSERYELTFEWSEIFKQFHEYQNSTENIEFKKMDEGKIKEILSSHDFSENRIDSGINKIKAIEESKKQKGLGEYF
jgi:flap endonuclease-1